MARWFRGPEGEMVGQEPPGCRQARPQLLPAAPREGEGLSPGRPPPVSPQRRGTPGPRTSGERAEGGMDAPSWPHSKRYVCGVGFSAFVGLGFPSRAVMSVTDSRFSKEEKNFLSLLPLRLVLRFFPASNKPGRVFPGADTQRLYHSLPLLMVSWCCSEAQVSCSRRNSPGNCPCMNRWVWAAASSSPTSLLFPPSSVSLCFPAPDQINQCFEILE